MEAFLTILFFLIVFMIFVIVTAEVPDEFKEDKLKERFNPYHDEEEPSVISLYNGGYKRYLASPEWKAIASKVRTRDKVCVKCSSAYGLQVHHLTYKNVYFEENHLDDLVTLCSTCHRNVNHRPILETWPGQ